MKVEIDSIKDLPAPFPSLWQRNRCLASACGEVGMGEVCVCVCTHIYTF